MTHPLVRNWRLLLLSAVVAGTAAFVTVSNQADQYQAQVRLLVGSLEGDFDSIRSSEALATTYAELANSRLLIGRAIEQAGISATASELRDDDHVEAVTVGTSRILLVTVTLSDPSDASNLANAMAAALQDFDPRASEELLILDDAAEAERVPTRLTLLVVLAAFGGGALVASLLMLFETLPTPRRA